MLTAAEALLRVIVDLGGAAALIASAIAELEGVALAPAPALERARAAPPAPEAAPVAAARPSPRELAAARARRYRENLPIKRAAGGFASSPPPAPTAHPDEGARHAKSVTERDGKRDASRSSVTERDGQRDASRSDRASLSLSFSEISEAWRERERENARASASRSSVTERDARDGKRDDPRPNLRDTLPSAGQGERPPPSGTPDPIVREWMRSRGLDPDHALAPHFLDVYRNAKPKSDWPATWRNFLRAEERARAAGPGLANGSRVESPEAYRARMAAADAAEEARRREIVAPPPLLATVFGRRSA